MWLWPRSLAVRLREICNVTSEFFPCHQSIEISVWLCCTLPLMLLTLLAPSVLSRSLDQPERDTLGYRRIVRMLRAYVERTSAELNIELMEPVASAVSRSFLHLNLMDQGKEWLTRRK